MTRDMSPHERAVALFSAMVDAPVAALCQRPVDLARPLGRASATAYRMVAEAETSGILQRDMHQSYRKGLIARQIGFSALGFGDLADLAEPILVNLREMTRLTALFAVAEKNLLHIGPYSLGRGPDYLRPIQRYKIDNIDLSSPILARRIHSDEDDKPAPYLRGLVVRSNTNATCLLCVISSWTASERAEGIDVILRQYSEPLLASAAQRNA